MSNKTIAILGGFGKAGQAIARHLVKETDAKILVLGRDLQRAREIAEKLNMGLPSPRVYGLSVNARDGEALRNALQNADIVVNCVRTIGFVETIVKAALDSGTDFLDITLNPVEIKQACNRYREEIVKQGRCFVTEAGILPGMPSALVAFAVARLGSVKRAAIGELMRFNDWPIKTLAEFLEDMQNLSWSSRIYRDGSWRRPKGSGKRQMDFGSPFGAQVCYPYQIPELTDMPKRLGLEDLGMYSAGFGHWIADTILVMILILKIGHRGRGAKLGARVLSWAMRRFCQPPFGLCLKLEAESEDGRKLEVILSHEDGYEATALPVVSCLLQWLDGSMRKPGHFMMGRLVEPVRLMADVERMGMQVVLKQIERSV
ncbi:MAG: hypothetical protein FJY66_06380 [Calditrichaeota bacterium]|nr:hypothetical protein [Calditrichota bacterium]